MYAIVDIAGNQVKVEKGQKILVNRLEGEKGSKVDFDKVLLITLDDKTAIGDPVIEGAQVQATILDHLKGDKVFVFKKKRRKGYKKLNGHRQLLSLLEIEEIIEKGAKPRKASEKPAPKAADKKEEEKTSVKAEVKEEKKPAVKTEKKEEEKPAAKDEKKEEEKPAAKAEKKEEEKPAAKAEKKEEEKPAAKAEKKEEEAKPKKSSRKKKTDEPEDTSEA